MPREHERLASDPSPGTAPRGGTVRQEYGCALPRREKKPDAWTGGQPFGSVRAAWSGLACGPRSRHRLPDLPGA